jgi:hypothetical protein
MEPPHDRHRTPFSIESEALSIGIKRGAVDDLRQLNTPPNEDRQI